MTILLEIWRDKDEKKTVATIRQDKDSKSYNVSIGKQVDFLRMETYFRGNYCTMKSARQAIKRRGNFERIEV